MGSCQPWANWQDAALRETGSLTDFRACANYYFVLQLQFAAEFPFFARAG